VDTLAPNVALKTTAEATDRETREIAAQFDRLLSGSDPKNQIASFERQAQLTSSTPITLKSKEEGAISFATTPGAALSSIAWRVMPLNDGKQQIMETNLCLTMNGEEICFTGVEDFAHCAFFTPCATGYSSLNPNERGGYTAIRYFPAGAAPVLRDGKVTAQFQAPDIGTVIEVDVKVRVRDVDSTLAGDRK
jgi:hypothetical protein